MAEDLAATINELWRQLQEDAEHHERVSDARIRFDELSTKVPSGKLCLGRTESGAAMLLIPVSPESRIRTDTLETDALAVRVEKYHIEPSARARPYLALTLRDMTLWDVFVAMVLDFVRRMEEGSGVVPALRAALDEFRRLVKSHGTGGPELEQLIGLLGELVVARHLAEAGARIPDCWTGPEGDVHDFRVGLDSVEVKTCMVSAGRRVTIHGIDQLADPTGGALLLVVNVVHEADHGGEALGEILGEVREQASDPVAFDERIRAAGFDPRRSAPEWSRRFVLEEQFWYRVGTDFPRLTRSELKMGDLPAEIDKLQYALSVGAGTPGRMSENDVGAWLGEALQR